MVSFILLSCFAIRLGWFGWLVWFGLVWFGWFLFIDLEGIIHVPLQRRAVEPALPFFGGQSLFTSYCDGSRAL